MRFLGLEITFAARRTIRTIGPQMDELELTACFAGADKTVLYKGVQQLIVVQRENLQIEAETSLNDPNRILACVGGSQQLALILEEIDRRQTGAARALRYRRPVVEAEQK